MNGIFVTDLHGKTGRYKKLFALVENTRPDALFIGGDILPHTMKMTDEYDDFIVDFLVPNLAALQNRMNTGYPEVFIIMGNDDPKIEESKLLEAQETGCLTYINGKKISFMGHTLFGYSWIPPTPFQLKDWEKYDVSRYADPGCTHPDEGFRSVDAPRHLLFQTIQKDLYQLTAGEDLSRAIFLFHAPPYNTDLDRAALDGRMIDHVPLDVHVGSIAIRRFIEDRQPLLTLHGHIHESTRLTGSWFQAMGQTLAVNAAHDGPELSAVVFDTENPEKMQRLII